MKILNEELFYSLIEDVNKGFSGWDFSYINGRMEEFPLSYSYTNEVLKEIKDNIFLLDMGTGGGEYLASFKNLPANTFATEGYKPNVIIARERLSSLGIEVYEVLDEENLPFNDKFFNLIINRHESYSVREIQRILKPEGIFITQQVGGLNDSDINATLECKQSEFYHWDLKEASKDLEDGGFHILNQIEDITKTRFYDIGAIIYYLKAIPWQIPDFSIEKYYDKLIEIHNKIQKERYIDFICHRFFIKAKKKQ